MTSITFGLQLLVPCIELFLFFPSGDQLAMSRVIIPLTDHVSNDGKNRISLGILYICFCGIIKSNLSELSGKDIEQSEVMMATSQTSYFKILSNVLKCI